MTSPSMYRHRVDLLVLESSRDEMRGRVEAYRTVESDIQATVQIDRGTSDNEAAGGQAETHGAVVYFRRPRMLQQGQAIGFTDELGRRLVLLVQTCAPTPRFGSVATCTVVVGD